MDDEASVRPNGMGGGQEPASLETLSNVISESLVIWLYALVPLFLTALIDLALVPLDWGLYWLVYAGLLLGLFFLTLTALAVSRSSKPVKPLSLFRIPIPARLEQGFTRFQTSALLPLMRQCGSTMTVIAFLIGGVVVFALWQTGVLHPGYWHPFYQVFTLLLCEAAAFIVFYFLASLVASLWPERHKTD